MENLQERLNQCQKDIWALKEQEKELKKQIENQEKPKFGDIVIVSGYFAKRIILYDESGKLVGIGKDGRKKGGLIPRQYTCTGQNIFTDNLLNLSI